MLCLHNEIVRIGNLRRLHHLLQCGVFHTKCYVIKECIIKQDRFLIYISYQATQIMNTEILGTNAINHDFTEMYVMVTRKQIYQRRFSRPGLPDQCNRLPLRNNKIDMFQHFPLPIITERNILKLDLSVHAMQRKRVYGFLNRILSLQNLIHTFHGSQTFRDVISCFCKILQRINDAIQNNHIENECRSFQRRMLIAQNQHTAKPKHQYNQKRSQELTHRMSQRLTNGHFIGRITQFITASGKAIHHLIFCNKRFNDAQAPQSFFQL